jgi:hypothetical protein
MVGTLGNRGVAAWGYTIVHFRVWDNRSREGLTSRRWSCGEGSGYWWAALLG